MSLLSGPSTARPDAHAGEKAAKDLESLIVKQLLQASGAFKGSEVAGSGLHADLFAEAIADAVAQSGGLGLADQLAPTLQGTASQAPKAPSPESAALHVPTRTPALPDLVEGPERVTSRFGRRADPFSGREKEHDGVDIGAKEGSAIYAAADGVVVRAGERGGYGEAVEVRHADGLSTLYAHASELLVKPGDVVKRGQEIARVGSTGHSTGAHLHFEVRQDGVATNPSRALKAYARRAEEGGRPFP